MISFPFVQSARKSREAIGEHIGPVSRYAEARLALAEWPSNRALKSTGGAQRLSKTPFLHSSAPGARKRRDMNRANRCNMPLRHFSSRRILVVWAALQFLLVDGLGGAKSDSPLATLAGSKFARVVKGVDLRSTAGNCAWVRTPQLAWHTSHI